MTAYELADKLQMDKAKALLYVDTVVQSAEMLRQQADRIAELEKEVDEYEELEQNYMKAIQRLQSRTPQTKPLSDEEIMQISHQALENSALIPKNNFMIAFAKAIEERHGIK